MLESDNTSYEVSGAIADVVQASAEFQSSEGVEHGVILSSGSAITATGNETGVDNAASSTNGGVGFFQRSDKYSKWKYNRKSSAVSRQLNFYRPGDFHRNNINSENI
jgi:hypothetical protein